MQNYNWNDLRYLLAVKRGKTLAKAAHLMKVDATTTSRRLSVLKSIAGEELYTRQRDGLLELTEVGESMASHIEGMELEADKLNELLGPKNNDCTGNVRITSVPIIINRLLSPNLRSLLMSHPRLQIDLIPDARNFSLNFRETYIAIRLARPVEGGIDTLAKRVGKLRYCVYASSKFTTKECNQLPWIGYQDDMSHTTTAQWIAEAASKSGQRIANIRVQDSETALEAVKAGLGKTLLPEIMANKITSLQQISKTSPKIAREIWLLTHSNQSKTKRIAEVSKWIETVISTPNPT